MSVPVKILPLGRPGSAPVFASRIAAIVCVAISIGIFYGCIFQPRWKAKQAQQWNKVPATVGESTVLADGRSATLRIAYTYQIDGRNYASRNYDFSPAVQSYNFDVAVTKLYPAGMTTTCFVNPQNPNESVLSPETHQGLGELLIECFAIVGYVAIAWACNRAAGKAKLARSTFGNIILELDDMPTLPGGALTGTIRMGHHLPCPIQGELTCFCFKGLERRRGKYQRALRTGELWKNTVQVSITSGNSLPVSVSLPTEGMALTETAPGETLFWRLRVVLKSQVANTLVCFDVPVLKSTMANRG